MKDFDIYVRASFERDGRVRISAASAEEAVETVKRLGKDKGATALDIQWQGSTREGAVKVKSVEAL